MTTNNKNEKYIYNYYNIGLPVTSHDLAWLYSRILYWLVFNLKQNIKFLYSLQTQPNDWFIAQLTDW